MSKIPYTKPDVCALWIEARDKYQNQLDSKQRKNSFSHEVHETVLEDRWLKYRIRFCNERIKELEGVL